MFTTFTLVASSRASSTDPLNFDPAPAPDSSTRSNTAPRLVRNLVKTAYQVFTLIEATRETCSNEIPHEIGHTIEYIYHKYHRPEPLLAEVPKGRKCHFKRSSAEPLAVPVVWATDTPPTVSDVCLCDRKMCCSFALCKTRLVRYDRTSEPGTQLGSCFKT